MLSCSHPSCFESLHLCHVASEKLTSPTGQHKTQLLFHVLCPRPRDGMSGRGLNPTGWRSCQGTAVACPLGRFHGVLFPLSSGGFSFFFFFIKRIICCILSQGKFKAGGGQFCINSNILWVLSFKRRMFLCRGENVYFLPSSSYLVLWPPRCGSSCAD